MPKILIAEDDKNLAKVLRINLESEGFETVVVHDGEAALSILEESKPDLLLLDIMMPKIDGLQVAKTVKGDPSKSAIPIIVLTAKGSEEDLMKGWELGAIDYFVKPFNLTRLMDAICHILNMPVKEHAPKHGIFNPAESAPINVALVGAEDAGIILLKFLLGNHRINIMGVADRDEHAEGLHLAQQMGIFVTTNIAEIFNLEKLSLILATKNASVLNLLKKDDSQEILAETGIHFLQTLVGENEEREHRERLLTQKLNASLQETKRIMRGILELIGQLTDEVSGHPEHTTLVRSIAQHLGVSLFLSQDALDMLDLAAALHDIGKLFLSKEELLRLSNLPDEERTQTDIHSAKGGDFLEKNYALKPFAPIVRAHHERWDGSGYPRKLSRIAIPLEARILAIADKCAHMLSEKKTRSDIITTMKKLAGSWFDPEIINILPETLEKELPVFV